MTNNTPIPENQALTTGVPKGGELIRIVIADDHPIFRDGLRKLLTLEEDFRVVAEAGDGKEVLEVLEEYQPDILLLDLNMPGLDGLTALQKLQNSRTKTKVIVLTASEDNNQFMQAMELGSCGIVLKQTATEGLIKSIRKVHSGEIWLDSQTRAAITRQSSSPMEPSPLGSSDRAGSSLTQREREIVALIAQGFKNKVIAEKMFISAQTVKNHLHHIFAKLGVSDRLELALYAVHKKYPLALQVEFRSAPKRPNRLNPIMTARKTSIVEERISPASPPVINAWYCRSQYSNQFCDCGTRPLGPVKSAVELLEPLFQVGHRRSL
jgi:DNA-binding NarL/FixJ family response regulator